MGKTEQVFKITNIGNVYYVFNYETESDNGTSLLECLLQKGIGRNSKQMRV